jgi:four helix bundle protein
MNDAVNTVQSLHAVPATPASPASISSLSSLPHHKLIAYEVAVELLLAVRAAGIRDTKLRDEALRSAKSACLNTAEGAGRVSRADKARAFAIARAEAGEAAAAVEIAATCGDASAEASAKVQRLASRLVALLTGLIR